MSVIIETNLISDEIADDILKNSNVNDEYFLALFTFASLYTDISNMFHRLPNQLPLNMNTNYEKILRIAVGQLCLIVDGYYPQGKTTCVLLFHISDKKNYFFLFSLCNRRGPQEF